MSTMTSALGGVVIWLKELILLDSGDFLSFHELSFYSIVYSVSTAVACGVTS